MFTLGNILLILNIIQVFQYILLHCGMAQSKQVIIDFSYVCLRVCNAKRKKKMFKCIIPQIVDTTNVK